MRANREGSTYFFTVVTYRRQNPLCDTQIRKALQRAIKTVRVKHPFKINAWILLPDHLHCIWTLPPDDADYATRWGMIKHSVSKACTTDYKRPEWINALKRKHRESTIWQRRYGEHQIRDEQDFARHVDYIYYNPVKHRVCKRAINQPYSTLHRDGAHGDYTLDQGSGRIDAAGEAFGE